MKVIYTIRRKYFNDVLGLGGVANAAGNVVNNTVNAAGQVVKQGVNTARDVTGGVTEGIGSAVKGVGEMGIGSTAGTVAGALLPVAGAGALGGTLGTLGAIGGTGLGLASLATPVGLGLAAGGALLGRAVGKGVDKGIQGVGSGLEKAGQGISSK